MRKVAKETKKITKEIISYSSIKRFYNTNSLYAFSSIKKPYLNKINIQKRFDATREWIMMNKNETESIIFLEELKFDLIYNDEKAYFWREPGKSLNLKHITRTVKH